MKITEDIIRWGGVGVVYVLSTVVFVHYMPEDGDVGNGFFLLFAILWTIVTTIGFCVGTGFLGVYFWGHAGAIADWINKQLAR